MKVFLGGARGSYTMSGADQMRHGGETFSLLAEGRDGEQVLIDAGTGVWRLKERLRPGGTVFFTHTHLDHLSGIPMLQEIWPQRMILPRGDLETVIAKVFSPPVWPVKMPPADYTVPAAPVEIGGLRVSWQAVAHPDGCVAYRIDEPATGAGLVVATDAEWPLMTPEAQAAFAEFARGADLLVFDAQYRPDEYPAHRGWGHSTWMDAVDAARRCGAARLWLMHHAPGRTDDELDAMAAEAAARFDGAVFPTASTMTEALHE